jgi:predicted house-cleaning noncanonical NTP pyrophosphatase (MazG superfamily)
MGVFSLKNIKEGSKRLLKTAGKAASKLNSLYKTFKPMIDPLLDSVTYGAGSKVLGLGSKLVDTAENFKNLSKDQQMDLIQQGGEFLIDTGKKAFNNLRNAKLQNEIIKEEFEEDEVEEVPIVRKVKPSIATPSMSSKSLIKAPKKAKKVVRKMAKK